MTINDLDFKLTSPAATTVQIMARSCNNEDNFNLNLDDEAAPGAWPCPPTGGGTYRPSNPLSAFDNQQPSGSWRLTVKDNVTNDGGSLNGWGLRICTNTQGPPAHTGNEKAFTIFAYDGGAIGAAPTQGNATLVRRYTQVTPSAAYVDTTSSYDSFGRTTVITDARNNATSTAYHSFYGYVTSVTNDLSQATSFVSDPGWGVVTKITDPNNRITELQYDGYGRLQKVWLPTESKASDPASLEFVYDAAARPAWVKSRTLQVKGTSTYLEGWRYVDGFGRNIQSQNPTTSGSNRIVTSTKYNNRGETLYTSAPYELSGAAGSGYSAPTWSTVANYHQFYYDELGRVTKDETRNLTTLLWDVETIYDAWSQQQYDPNNHRRDYSYDAFGQLVQVKEYYATSSFYTTAYAYDLQGNLTGVTDHLSNATSMSYDLLGRKTAMTDPDMGSWQYQYDAVGNLTGQRDGRSQWLYLEYDDLNRPVRKRRDTAGSGPLVAEYGYDAVGQIGLPSFSKSYNSAGTTVEVQVQQVAYDARNRLTQQQWVVSGSGTFRMDYAYNEADQSTSLTYPGGNGGTQGEAVSYSYNAIGQLSGVTGAGGTQYVSAATYNAQGQLTELRNDSGVNGLTRQFVYETNTLRLSTIKAGISSPYENLQKLSYTYDNAGNVTSLTDALNSGQKQCFQYDWLDRLTAAFTGNSGCTAYDGTTGTGVYNHTYAYDAIGNITSYAGNSYTYGDAAHKHAVTAAFGNSYGYDANGNQTSRTIGGTTYTFTFDYENRLTAISGGSMSASFVYDAAGNRVKGTVGGVTTVYIAGIYEYQGGATTHYYEGNALRRTGYASDNGVFYLLQDHLKSSSAIINQNGTLNSRNFYFPFGGNRGTTFSNLTTKRFTGQYHENSLPGGEGLSYYGARWYDAKLGRFLSADTIVPGPANPQALNRYSYVFNNPLGLIDPSGHAPAQREFTAGGGGGRATSSQSGGGSSTVHLPIVSNGSRQTNSSQRSGSRGSTVYLPLVSSGGGQRSSSQGSDSWFRSWVSNNNIPTAVGIQAGVDSGVGYWLGGTSGSDWAATFNWWSGEVAITTTKSANVRVGLPQATVGVHAGVTFTAGASDILRSIVGASRVTSIDASGGVLGDVGGSASWSRAYDFTDLNGDDKFGMGGYSEPLEDPYQDPVFRRTVDALSVNVGIGVSVAPSFNAGVSHGMADTDELYVVNIYAPIRAVVGGAQRAWDQMWRD